MTPSQKIIHGVRERWRKKNEEKCVIEFLPVKTTVLSPFCVELDEHVSVFLSADGNFYFNINGKARSCNIPPESVKCLGELLYAYFRRKLSGNFDISFGRLTSL